jgi:tetratricopeptide (TPR) repeat protein
VSIEGASPLHQALYAAIETRDADAFNALLREHGGDLLEQFGTWTKVPQEIRANREATARYVDSLVTIARLFEANGQPAFMQRITGPDATNPALVWKRGVAEAQALSNAGEYATSSAKLEKILAEMQGASGNVVDELKPKILGSLGTNALHVRDFEIALDYNERAYEACAAVGDEEGLVAYYDNLQSLRLIARLKTGPERAERLLGIRRLICRAQDAADAGRYGVSLSILSGVLPALTDDGDDGGFRALLPKVHGLIGYNEHRLGNKARAREQIALALQSAKDFGDLDGVRIYTVSLQTLDA